MGNKRPKIGLVVVVVNNKNEVLLIKRKGAHGSGTWGLPGGHMEWMESFEDSGRRECLEEVGIILTQLKFLGVTNDLMKNENKHYVTIFLQAEIKKGKPKILEPNKAEDMGWFNLRNFPKPLFIPLSNFLNSDIDCLCGSGKKYKECHGK